MSRCNISWRVFFSKIILAECVAQERISIFKMRYSKPRSLSLLSRQSSKLFRVSHHGEKNMLRCTNMRQRRDPLLRGWKREKKESFLSSVHRTYNIMPYNILPRAWRFSTMNVNRLEREMRDRNRCFRAEFKSWKLLASSEILRDGRGSVIVLRR